VPFVSTPMTGACCLGRRAHRPGGRVRPDGGHLLGRFITGDEVTASFEQCECGRTTAHVASAIERFSEKKGGDDKITCVAAEDAHRAALEFLTDHLS